MATKNIPQRTCCDIRNIRTRWNGIVRNVSLSHQFMGCGIVIFMLHTCRARIKCSADVFYRPTAIVKLFICKYVVMISISEAKIRFICLFKLHPLDRRDLAVVWTISLFLNVFWLRVFHQSRFLQFKNDFKRIFLKGF